MLPTEKPDALPAQSAPMPAPQEPFDPNAERRRMMLAQLLAQSGGRGNASSPWAAAGQGVGQLAGMGISALMGAGGADGGVKSPVG